MYDGSGDWCFFSVLIDQMTPLMLCCSSSSSNEKSLVNVLKLLLSAGANLIVHDRWVCVITYGAQFLMGSMIFIYCMAGNIDVELNLTVWQSELGKLP